MNSNKKIPLIAVVGPTATGKTDLGVGLALALSGEVVSADSMQIYKGMPIASAVPTLPERRGVEHHLMEFLDIDEEFSVADYVNLAKEKIIEIYSRGNQPILVGGTGLYVNSLIDNITFSEEKTDEALRSGIEAEYDRLGGEEMLYKLSLFDAPSAARLHPSDKRRIVRAFEIYLQTGKTQTECRRESRAEPSPFETTLIGITYRDREKIYERIGRRVDKMLENGLLEEAAKIAATGNRGAGQAIGHKELMPYLKGLCSLEDATEILKRETRRYAKRQYTWWRRDGRVNWIYADETPDALGEALDILRKAGEA